MIELRIKHSLAEISRCYPNEQLTGERHSSACHRHIIKYQTTPLDIRKSTSHLLDSFQRLS
jgi:hypothetical protein